MRVTGATFDALGRGLSFIKRQPRDWKVSAVRTSTHRFIYKMVLPYLSVYTRELGATGTQLDLGQHMGIWTGAFTVFQDASRQRHSLPCGSNLG